MSWSVFRSLMKIWTTERDPSHLLVQYQTRAHKQLTELVRLNPLAMVLCQVEAARLS
jgi:hypothetical protein